MAKFKVYEKEQQKEKIIFFKLREDIGEILLVACDEAGKELVSSNILTITAEGRLIRYSGISPDIGLQLTDLHRIELIDD